MMYQDFWPRRKFWNFFLIFKIR